MNKKVYISGKITGMEEEAAMLFEKAEQHLLSLGYEPVNPMKLNHDHGLTWSDYMRVDIIALCCCGKVYMLKNWLSSKGAKLEHEIACELDHEIIYEL